MKSVEELKVNRQSVTFEFQPGDALFFFERTIHRAGGNETNAMRLSSTLSMH